MPRYIDISGRRFGRLVVLDRDAVNSSSNKPRLRCRCDCGKEVIVINGSLKSGHTLSCGCYNKEIIKIHVKTHGMTRTNIYRIWKSMMQRCCNERDKSYYNYGARGIRVCSRWHKFENWYADMGDRPTPQHSIERINNDGDYLPSNCKWATRAEQNSNKRVNHYIEYNGQRKTMRQWSVDLGFSYQTLASRINKLHWPIEKALSSA